MGKSLTTGRSREQLVAGVVEDAGALVGADPSLDLDRAAGLDAGDPAPAEPDDGDDACAVVELGLEDRHAGPRAQGDGPQRAPELDPLAVRSIGDRGGAGLARPRVLLAEMVAVLVAGVGPAADVAAQLALAHRVAPAGQVIGSAGRPGGPA